MGDYDILIGLSLIANVFFILIFQKLHTMWASPGIPNFFMQQVMVALNRIKNPKIIHGANNSRFAPLYIAGENQPIYPDPSNKTNLPLQFESKNVYLGARGMPHVFAFEGNLNNQNPLENSNDDVQLSQAALATEKFIQLEVERRHAKDNPFKKLSMAIFIVGAIMVLGFIIVGSTLIGIQDTAVKVNNKIQQYSPYVDKILENPEAYGLPTNFIGSTPTSPPPSNPFLNPLQTASGSTESG